MARIKKGLIAVLVACMALSLTVPSVTAATAYAAVKTTNKNTVTIKFDANGGSVEKDRKNYSKGKKYGQLPSAQRNGYVFAGWFTKKTGGTEVVKTQKAKKSKTVYAHWFKKPAIIAHRGYRKNSCENSIRAMRDAVRMGYDGIECDVVEAANGNLYIFHDDTLDRMTGTNGSIYDLNFDNYMDYTLPDRTHIPRLEDVIATTRNMKHICLHIKGNGKADVLSADAQRKISDLLDKYGVRDKTTIILGRTAMQNLTELNNVEKCWTTLSSDPDFVRSMIRQAQEEGIDMIILNYAKQITAEGNQKDLVSYAHDHGVKIGTFFCNTKYLHKKMAEYGIDIEMTDGMSSF